VDLRHSTGYDMHSSMPGSMAKGSCIKLRAHRRYLAETTERPVRGGGAALCQITVITCSVFLSCVSVCFTLIINLCFSCTSQPPRSALLLIPPLSYQLRRLHSVYCNQSSIYLSTSAAAELVSVDDSQGNDAA